MSKKQSGGFAKRKAQEAEERRRAQRRRNIYTGLGLAALVVIVLATVAIVRPMLGGDDAGDEAAGQVVEVVDGERPLADIEPVRRNGYYDTAPGMVIDADAEYEAIISTEKGDMRLALFAAEAPMTVNNFVFLANQGFYDGTTFHRVIEDFMAQGGDPSGSGSGGPGYEFADETDNGLLFDRPGLLAMANAGPNTNGSQFFITYAETPWLDGNHTIFGELIEGRDVLDALRVRDPMADPQPGDVIETITIEKRS